jgi:hypothetical protein
MSAATELFSYLMDLVATGPGTKRVDPGTSSVVLKVHDDKLYLWHLL